MRNMFSDDEDEEGLDEDEDRGSRARNNIVDEFDDFIEEDEFSDEDEEAQRARREKKKKMKKKGARIDTSKLSSVDRQSLQELFEVLVMVMNMIGHWKLKKWKIQVIWIKKNLLPWMKFLNILN